VWCGKCQHRCVTHRTTHRGKVYGQYRCGNFDNKPPQTRYCHAPGIGQVVLETAAWAMIWEVLTNPVLLLEMGQAYYDSLPRPESEGMKERERELARLRDREEVVLELMKRKLMKIADGQREIEQDIRPRVAMIREELRMAGRIVRLPSRQEVEATLREITDGPEPETYQDRRNILEGINELRMSYLEGELEISGKVPIRTKPMELTTSGKKNCNPCLEVVFKERPPGLGGRLVAAHKVLAHAGLADFDTELKQLAMNPRRAPEWILAAHGANQCAHFLRHAWSPRLTVSDLPGPEQAKAFSVPADDGRGLDDKDAGLPVGPDRAEPSPQESIRRCQFGSLDGALQNAELMAKGEDLELKRRAAPEGSEKGSQESGQ
jgi:hypothetical protein